MLKILQYIQATGAQFGTPVLQNFIMTVPIQQHMILMEFFSHYQRILNLKPFMIQQNHFNLLIKLVILMGRVLMYLKVMGIWMKVMKKLLNL